MSFSPEVEQLLAELPWYERWLVRRLLTPRAGASAAAVCFIVALIILLVVVGIVAFVIWLTS